MSWTRKVFWPREAEATLIEKVRDYPVLWDSSHELYAKKTLRRKHLQEVAEHVMRRHPALTYTADDVRNKFNNLKNYYVKERRRHVQSNGTNGAPSSKWAWFKLLSFLEFVATPGSHESNLSPLESKFCTEVRDSIDTCGFSGDEDDTHSWNADNIVVATPAKPSSTSPLIKVTDSEDICGFSGDEEDTHSWNADNIVVAASARPPSTSPATSSSLCRERIPSKKRRQNNRGLSEEITPRKKRRVNNNSSNNNNNNRGDDDAMTAAISVLNKAIDQEQDFAYGTGVQLVHGMRKLPYDLQLQFAGEALILLQRFNAKKTE